MHLNRLSRALPPAPWRVAVRVLLFLSACAIVLAASTPFARLFPRFSPALLIGLLATLGALGLTALFVRWEELRLADAGAWCDRGSVGRLAVGLLIGSLLVATQSAVMAFIGHVQWRRVGHLGPVDVATIAVTYLLLASREELAFHGYPLRRLEGTFGLWTAQGWVALVFALEHMAGGWAIARAVYGAAVGSLLFGMASIATRGLAVPIGLHAAWNIGDALRGGKDSGGIWQPMVAEAFQGRAHVAGIISYVAVFGTATLGFWWWWRRGIRVAPGPISRRLKWSS